MATMTIDDLVPHVQTRLNLSSKAKAKEAIQTVLRAEGYPNPYEALRDLTRTNAKIDRESIHAFIAGLNVSDEVRQRLLSFTPENYTGVDGF